MPETDQSATERLIDLSVRDFVDAVASAERPVPAGGSVAALSGASSAALLALVCGVVERRTGSGALLEQVEQLHQLQTELLDLVDEDAAAFHAYLHAGRSGVGQDTALERMTRGPLAIGWSCAHIIELSHTVETLEVRHMRGDVRAARHLAQASARTALDIAESNIPLQKDHTAGEALKQEIARLRARLP